MRSAKTVGRIIGLMLLVRLLLAPLVYFELMPPATGRGFLATAAGSALQIRVGVLLAFVLGALTLAIAIAATPIFRRYGERMALAFLALSIVGLATLAADNVGILNMVSLSLESAKAGASNELFQTLGRMARSTWYGAHFTNLMLGHATGLVFIVILYRSALVPRALAAFGLAAALVSLPAVVMPLLGYRFVYLMIIPAALSQLAVTLWLIVRGFEERQHPLRGDAERLELAGA
jgi:uncharacterized protein DUF4386